MHFSFRFLTQQIEKLIAFFLPAQCLLCHLTSNDKLICEHCQKALLQPRTCCLYCGLSLTNSQPFCGDCLNKKHLFTQLHALASYQPPYAKLIKQLKYKKQLTTGELLGQLLSHSILARFSSSELKQFDYIIAVPLHNKKLRQRGFNQAQLIAEVVAKQLNIPLLVDAISRNKATQVQEGLSVSKRKRNLQGAFSVRQNAQWQGKHILVLDDVVTTGATINSLSQCLLTKNVASITVLCICRTALHR